MDKYPALQQEREDKEKKRWNSTHFLKHPFDHVVNMLKKTSTGG